ncbi:MAG: DUF4394 domain-containing protein [Chitinophagaceae bacterium]
MSTTTNFTNKFVQAVLALSLSSFLMPACTRQANDIMAPAAMRPDIIFYALNDNNQLARYNAQTAEMPEPSMNITGIPAGEKIISIDFRPATGQLYGLSSGSRLYSINLNSGAATPLGAASFTPAISGNLASIDFNPTVDRVRLVTNTGQNLRLHPETGAVAFTDGAINGGSSPAISSIAYTNSIAGAAATDLFDIDVNTKKLYKQTPPNDGTLLEVGTIPVNFTGKGGFDINADNSVALATLTVNGQNKLYSINTATAAAEFLADLSGNIMDIAIPTPAVAYTISDNNMFQIFNPFKANSVINKTITGLGAGESFMGIDFRPVNGQLYGIATDNAGNAKLYTFNLSSGAVAPVGTGFLIGMAATAVGFDFNPTVDRIRLVTNTGQNLRLNPNDGTIAATDGNLNPGTPMISGAAYTNNFPGATTTVLYVLDKDKLYRQDPPNMGTLVETGPLGIVADAQNGFDIGGTSNKAYAVLTVANVTKVYNINISSVSPAASIDFPNKVKGFSIGLGF